MQPFVLVEELKQKPIIYHERSPLKLNLSLQLSHFEADIQTHKFQAIITMQYQYYPVLGLRQLELENTSQQQCK
jgi:hypothetical protein